jgi:hypothetical protein
MHIGITLFLIWYNAGLPNNVLPNDISPKSTESMFCLITFRLNVGLPNNISPKCRFA